MVGEREPGDEALLQPGGRHVGDPRLLELVVVLAGQVGVLQVDPAAGGGDQARAGAQEHALAAAFHARQPDGLAPPDIEVHRVELDAAVLGAHAGQAEETVARGAGHALSRGDLPLEHHGDQAVDLERGQRLSDEPPLPEHGDAGAELLHLLQLVRDEQDGLALVGQAAKSGEELLALGGADPGRGLVEDEHAGAEPQEAEELELLPLADREGLDVGLEIDREPQRRRPARRPPWPLRPAGDESPRGADEQVVDDAHGREIEGVLVQHADAVADRVGRGAHGDRLAVEHDLPAVRRLEAREDLHEGALARPVLAEDALDASGGNREGDAVVGFDRAEMLADISYLYFHPNSGPLRFCCPR